MSPKQKERLLRGFFLFISIVISTVIILERDKLAGLEEYGYPGIFLISLLGNSTVIIPAPVILTAFVGGTIFNPFFVGLVTAAGATIGELTGFLAGHGGKVFVKSEKTYQKIEGWIHKKGFLTIFVLALIPNPLFDLAGIAAGVTGYPVLKFLAATLLGKSIKFLALAFIGASLT